MPHIHPSRTSAPSRKGSLDSGRNFPIEGTAMREKRTYMHYRMCSRPKSPGRNTLLYRPECCGLLPFSLQPVEISARGKMAILVVSMCNFLRGHTWSFLGLSISETEHQKWSQHPPQPRAETSAMDHGYSRA